MIHTITNDRPAEVGRYNHSIGPSKLFPAATTLSIVQHCMPEMQAFGYHVSGTDQNWRPNQTSVTSAASTPPTPAVAAKSAPPLPEEERVGILSASSVPVKLASKAKLPTWWARWRSSYV